MPEPLPPAGDVTQLLLQWRSGDDKALGQLMPLVYERLRSIAGRYLKSERSGHTLQCTGLVHEAYLRLVDGSRVEWQNRAHFLGVAAGIMRNILVDHARLRNAAKRGGSAPKMSLEEASAHAAPRDADIIAVHDSLLALEKLDPQQSRIVELRFFGGLTIEETAEVIGVSDSTVKRDWVLAKSWIFRELSSRGGTP